MAQFHQVESTGIHRNQWKDWIHNTRTQEPGLRLNTAALAVVCALIILTVRNVYGHVQTPNHQRSLQIFWSYLASFRWLFREAWLTSLKNASSIPLSGLPRKLSSWTLWGRQQQKAAALHCVLTHRNTQMASARPQQQLLILLSNVFSACKYKKESQVAEMFFWTNKLIKWVKYHLL